MSNNNSNEANNQAYGPQHTVNDREIKSRARKMSPEALAFSAQDAHEAAEAAEALERAGCPISKTGGYYRDEATLYRAELSRRGLNPNV